MTQSYLAISISTLVALPTISADDYKDLLISGLMVFYIVFWPYFTYLILLQNFKNLADPNCRRELGSVYANFEPTKKSVYVLTMAYLYKRLLLAAAIAFLSQLQFA